MKKLTINLILMGTLIVLFLSHDAIAQDSKAGELTSEKDKASYMIGADIAQTIVPIKEEVNLDKLLMGFSDKFNEKPLLVTQEDAQVIMRDFSAKMQTKMAEKIKELTEKNETEGNAYLNENKAKKGVITTDSGLQYSVLSEGKGSKPTETDKVKVHYQGTLVDGTVFDSTYTRGEPIVFPVNGVIKGWTEALLLMNVGSKYKLAVPSDLAYGPRGFPPVIGPSAVLVFEVELLDIEK